MSDGFSSLISTLSWPPSPTIGRISYDSVMRHNLNNVMIDSSKFVHVCGEYSKFRNIIFCFWQLVRFCSWVMLASATNQATVLSSWSFLSFTWSKQTESWLSWFEVKTGNRGACILHLGSCIFEHFIPEWEFSWLGNKKKKGNLQQEPHNLTLVTN